MTKVITYGTYDLLHYGHIRLLERAKALGDYLIVGVTSDDYDQSRGKINNQQTLMERIAAVKATGIPDEIIVEEYEGQKIDDIKRYGADIFTVGSDWKGKFDYLGEYCKVVYLDRTQGVSSSEIRTEERSIRLGIIGGEDGFVADKFLRESRYVDGLCAAIVEGGESEYETDGFDAFYVVSPPERHYGQIKRALEHKKHVLCESPIAPSRKECSELFALAQENGCVLAEGIKTAYSTAYNRLVLQIKSGKIGQVVSVDATCTSMRELEEGKLDLKSSWNSICEWGPTALLPVFQILGTDYRDCRIVSRPVDKDARFDGFTKIDFIFDGAVASVKVAKTAKSEGELIVSGTKGYIYVPAPWWKTDYYEIRYENQSENIRQFYALEGEGIRQELVSFLKSIRAKKNGNRIDMSNIDEKVGKAISRVIEKFYRGEVTVIG